MTKETGIRLDLAVYREEMGDELTAHDNIGEDRLKLIVVSSALALKHFFETGEYGDPEKCTPDTLPAYWPYVRYLVYDALRARFGHGKSEFVTQRYSDDFLEDIVDEALAIADGLPKDMTHEEWRLFVDVSAHMMMADPFFVKRGLVTETGQEGFMSQSLRAGMIMMTSNGDMYQLYLQAWKEQSATGPRNTE
jgi:hypothetical protein